VVSGSWLVGSWFVVRGSWFVVMVRQLRWHLFLLCGRDRRQDKALQHKGHAGLMALKDGKDTKTKTKTKKDKRIKMKERPTKSKYRCKTKY
jgi:hypothetical protein